MDRTAKCLCGEVSIRVDGEPKLTFACNCTNCQRRTGSVFGTVAYFADNQVIEKTGEPKPYRFSTDSGNSITTAFCSNCGSTVHWQADLFKGMTGIAAGCFNDPSFPEPSAAVWTRSQYQWVDFPDHWHRMEKQTP